MKPIQLEIRDVLGIREARLEFEPGVVAVVGANGAGKSSILDGLVIALFGEASPARAVRKSELVRLGTEAGEVILAFESGGESYRVSRRFRNGKGQEASFDRWNGTLWEPVASTVTEVNRAVGKVLNPWARGQGEESLGRLREAFLHSVFIPQGMVTRLIDARPADRWAVLASVLGLEQEEGLKERARALLEIAQGEERLGQGRLEALKDRLEALPSEEELDRREAEVTEAIREGTCKKKAILQVLEVRKRLDESMSRLEKARLDLEEGELRFRKVREQHRLGRAWEGLVGLQRAARSFGEIRKAFREKREAFGDLDKEAARAGEQLERLRQSYARTLGAFRELDPLARQADPVRRFLEARASSSRLEEKKKQVQNLVSKEMERYGDLEKALAGAERASLLARLEKTRAEHVAAGRELAGLLEKIVGTLFRWLEDLADEEGVVRLDRFTGARALELARNFRDSDLQRLVDRQGRVRQHCLALLERGRELRASLALVPPIPGEPCVHEDPGKLKERLDALGRETERLRGGLESLEDELVRSVRLRDELARALPDLSEDFFASVIDAAEKRESLSLELEMLQERGEKARQSFDLLREKRAVLQGDLGRIEERKANALRVLARERSNWETLRETQAWSVNELRRALELALPPLDDRELAGARGNLEAARIASERADRDLEILRARIPDEPPPLRELEELLQGQEKGLIDLVEKRSAVRQVRESRKKLEEEVERNRQEVERLLPAFDAARRMVRLTDGKGFIRFVSDNLLATLLGEVNGKLADRGWAIRANQGVFEVVQDGRVRPASGLSGGERAFLALLFLRQLSARTGFHKVLFIDEGLAMLDDGHLEEVVDFLGTVGHDAFVAVITHDPEVAACFPRRWEVDKGRVSVRQEV